MLPTTYQSQKRYTKVMNNIHIYFFEIIEFGSKENLYMLNSKYLQDKLKFQ